MTVLLWCIKCLTSRWLLTNLLKTVTSFGSPSGYAKQKCCSNLPLHLLFFPLQSWSRELSWRQWSTSSNSELSSPAMVPWTEKSMSGFAKQARPLAIYDYMCWTNTTSSSAQSIIFTSLLYGCETWTLDRRHLKLLEHLHMHSLRSICIWWQDKITNMEALDRVETTGIKALILKSQLWWTGISYKWKTQGCKNSCLMENSIWARETKALLTKGSKTAYRLTLHLWE